MFFMIGLYPKEKILKTLFLNCPLSGRLEQADIIMQGNQLVLFFLPIFTFSKQFFVRFPSGSIYKITGMDQQQILDASREELENHLELFHQQPRQNICPYCGSILQEDFVYCPHCGRPLK